MVPFWNFAPIIGFIAGIFGLGGLFAAHHPPEMPVPTAPTHAVSVETRSSSSSSSPQTTVVTDVNGQKQTKTVQSRYGVKTSVVTRTINGHTTTEASTTPLTAADVQKMQAQEAQMESHMRQMFANQQKMFQDMWGNF